MNTPSTIDRRDFLTKSLPAGAGLCLGCWLALTESSGQEPEKPEATPPSDSFRTQTAVDTGMSYERVFNFAFRDHSIPYLLALADRVGRDKLVEMLKATTDDLWFRREFRQQFFKNFPADWTRHAVVQQQLEKTDQVMVLKVTRCLWAETYRAANAADIGYAMWCYGDYAMARSSKRKLERNQTLMQGHECCLLKWTKEA
jgi:hypothetical protein